jgi:NAD(P)-dependent dehydrogenase (short-subunit alcohol dehydrogenase family)
MSTRVAIVVGAGGELGRATAEKLAAAGFTVVGIDRSEDGLKKLPDGIRYEAGDATLPAVAKSLVDRIAAEVVRPMRWSTPSARTTSATRSPRRPRTCG